VAGSSPLIHHERIKEEERCRVKIVGHATAQQGHKIIDVVEVHVPIAVRVRHHRRRYAVGQLVGRRIGKDLRESTDVIRVRLAVKVQIPGLGEVHGSGRWHQRRPAGGRTAKRIRGRAA
jgi:hypothetical protein